MAKQEEKNKLAAREPQNLAVPAYLRDDVPAGSGSEDVGQSDLAMPRLGLAQSLSPQLRKTHEAYIEGLAVGDFFNTATGEVYGTEVTVIPVRYFRSYIEFTPIDQGGGIVAQYADASEVPPEDLKFGPAGEKPKVTEFKNRLCLLLRADGSTEPVVVSTKSAGLKTMKVWNTKILEKKVASIKQLWRLVAVTRTNGANEWQGFKAEAAGWTPEAVYPKARDFLAAVAGKTIVADTTGLADEQVHTGEKVPF